MKAFELSGNKDQSTYNKLINCKKENDEYIRRRKELLLHDEVERGPKV